MRDYKQHIKQLINISAQYFPSSALIKIAKQKEIAPLYHTISNKDLPHINQLYPVKNTNEFIKDLDFLLKHYQAVDYTTYIKIKSGELTSKKPVFLLTFDDGLSEFYDIISPILLKKGIPAICFCNSNFIDNKNLFFRYKVSLLINQCLQSKYIYKDVSSSFSNQKNTFENLLLLKHHHTHIIDQIAEKINFSFSDYLKNHQPYLTSLQIDELINKGFQFGAHSIDHPEYQYLDLENQITQTKESVDFISEKFNLDYKTFAFPFTDYGVNKNFFNLINKHQITDNTFGCAGQKIDIIKNNYQRIPFENAKLTGKTIHNSELLRYILKKPLNKHIIKRNG